MCLCLKARKHLNESIRRIIERRKVESSKYGGGLLGVLLQARSSPSRSRSTSSRSSSCGEEKKVFMELTDSQVADNLIGVIFAAHDTTASALTWVLKYLHDNSNLLEAVTVTLLFYSFFFFFFITFFHFCKYFHSHMPYTHIYYLLLFICYPVYIS